MHLPFSLRARPKGTPEMSNDSAPQGDTPAPAGIDTDARVAVLEAAVTKALNLNLDEFDPAASVAARREALEAAKAEAMAVLEKAVDEKIVQLSTEERFARLERAVTQGSGVSLDG